MRVTERTEINTMPSLDKRYVSSASTLYDSRINLVAHLDLTGFPTQQPRFRPVRDSGDSSTQVWRDVGLVTPRYRNYSLQRRGFCRWTYTSHPSFLNSRRSHFLLLLQDRPFLAYSRIETCRISSVRYIPRNAFGQEDLRCESDGRFTGGNSAGRWLGRRREGHRRYEGR